jgi:hypothetical protein
MQGFSGLGVCVFASKAFGIWQRLLGVIYVLLMGSSCVKNFSWQVLRLGRWFERCLLYVAGLNPFRVINLLEGCTSASGVAIKQKNRLAFHYSWITGHKSLCALSQLLWEGSAVFSGPR